MGGGKSTEESLRSALANSNEKLRKAERRRDDPSYKRNLTDDDVDAIAEALFERVTTQFYQDVGKGVWSLAKKGAAFVLVALATYGYFGGHWPKP